MSRPGCAVRTTDERRQPLRLPDRGRHSPAELIVEVRPARADDLAAIAAVHRAAFGGALEARLVELLHDRGKAPISLVAEISGAIVGHVLFSPVDLDPPVPHVRAVGLAPLGVLPRYQRRGIGSRLIRDGLRLCADAGYEVVVVLGDPAFYSGFGFVQAAANGLGSEYAVDEHFMVIELKLGALRGVRATVRYQSEFREVEL